MTGVLATHQGNSFKFKLFIPHYCKIQSSSISHQRRCLISKMLSASAIDQPTSFSSFDLVVGSLDIRMTLQKPQNLKLLTPGLGYTCGLLEDDTPTVGSVGGVRRDERVFRDSEMKQLPGDDLSLFNLVACLWSEFIGM